MCAVCVCVCEHMDGIWWMSVGRFALITVTTVMQFGHTSPIRPLSYREEHNIDIWVVGHTKGHTLHCSRCISWRFHLSPAKMSFPLRTIMDDYRNISRHSSSSSIDEGRTYSLVTHIPCYSNNRPTRMHSQPLNCSAFDIETTANDEEPKSSPLSLTPHRTKAPHAPAAGVI